MNEPETFFDIFFPVPKEDTKRTITFSNNSDFISFRHHIYRNNAGKIELAEMGPRFEMRLFQIKQGTNRY